MNHFFNQFFLLRFGNTISHPPPTKKKKKKVQNKDEIKINLSSKNSFLVSAPISFFLLAFIFSEMHATT